MNERYWTEQIAKKDAEIQRLTNLLIEKAEYEGRWYSLQKEIPLNPNKEADGITEISLEGIE